METRWLNVEYITRSHDNDGNVIDRVDENPILDTREYAVEFEDGHRAELTANTVDQSMHAQYDPDRNISKVTEG